MLDRAVVEVVASLGIAGALLNREGPADLPESQMIEYIRQLLITSRILPPRDRHRAGFRRWLRTK